MKVKVVVDTSVWVAAILSNQGASHEVFKKALGGEFDIVVSYKIYEEFAEVIARPSVVHKAHLSTGEIKKLRYFLKRLKKRASEKIRISRDPNDDMFVNCAVSFGASAILSLDKDLLDIGEYKNITFISPGDFLKMLRRKK